MNVIAKIGCYFSSMSLH